MGPGAGGEPFVGTKVQLADVAAEFLDHLAAVVPGVGAWLMGVPMGRGYALRIIAARDVQVPLLFTIQPVAKGVLAEALDSIKPVTQDQAPPGGAWFEAELGVGRIACAVRQGDSVVAVVGGYASRQAIDTAVGWALNEACAQAAAPLAAAARLSRVEEELEALRRVLEAVDSFAEARDGDELVRLTLDVAADMSEAEMASVMLYDRADAVLRIAASTHLPEDVVSDTAIRLGEGIAGWVAQAGQGTVIDDADEQRRANKNRPVRSAVCVPMVTSDGSLWGVINVGSKVSGQFSDVDVGRLSTLAGYAAKWLARMEEATAGSG